MVLFNHHSFPYSTDLDVFFHKIVGITRGYVINWLYLVTENSVEELLQGSNTDHSQCKVFFLLRKLETALVSSRVVGHQVMMVFTSFVVWHRDVLKIEKFGIGVFIHLDQIKS